MTDQKQRIEQLRQESRQIKQDLAQAQMLIYEAENHYDAASSLRENQQWDEAMKRYVESTQTYLQAEQLLQKYVIPLDDTHPKEILDQRAHAHSQIPSVREARQKAESFAAQLRRIKEAEESIKEAQTHLTKSSGYSTAVRLAEDALEQLAGIEMSAGRLVRKAQQIKDEVNLRQRKQYQMIAIIGIILILIVMGILFVSLFR